VGIPQTPNLIRNYKDTHRKNYKDTHRNKPENCFFGAARYQGCLVNSGVVIDMPVPIRA
jgi:hypothetical protein